MTEETARSGATPPLDFMNLPMGIRMNYQFSTGRYVACLPSGKTVTGAFMEDMRLMKDQGLLTKEEERLLDEIERRLSGTSPSGGEA